MAQVEIANDKQAQSLTRRTFLQDALAGGTSTTLLAGCALSNQASITPTPIVKKPTILNWICETGYNGSIASFQMLTQRYNALNKDQITINVQSGAAYGELQQMFNDPDPAKRAQYDILSLDVVWISEFASKGWIISLDDRYWPNDRTRQPYLKIPLQAASYHGKIYGAPMHTDVGILYYRTDFSDIIKPENIKSWDNLASMALEAQQQKGVRSGFTWAALAESENPYDEGLICNFVEMLSGYGGKIFDNPREPSLVLVNSPEARNTLYKMSTWIQTISPGVTNFRRDGAAREWISGQAAFMRNWPAFVINSSDHSNSVIADKFDITTLPFSTTPHLGGGCLGGWQLAINSNSTPEKQDKAWNFIWWMLQHDAQHYLAIKENFPVTLAEIYVDKQINKRNVYYSRIQNYINNAQFRPSTPNYYQGVRGPIVTMISSVFAGTATPDEALAVLETQLQKVVHSRSSS
jgi:multiple sugar transport system substrate-binding protein